MIYYRETGHGELACRPLVPGVWLYGAVQEEKRDNRVGVIATAWSYWTSSPPTLMKKHRYCVVRGPGIKLGSHNDSG